MLDDSGEVPEGEFTLPIGVANVERQGERCHDRQLWPPAAARRPAGGRGAGQRSRHRRRADRPPHASPARYADDSRLHQEDQSLRHRRRRLGLLRHGQRHPLPHPKAGLRLSRCPDRIRPQRRDPRSVQPSAGRSDAAKRGPDRQRGEGSLLSMKGEGSGARGQWVRKDEERAIPLPQSLLATRLLAPDPFTQWLPKSPCPSRATR